MKLICKVCLTWDHRSYTYLDNVKCICTQFPSHFVSFLVLQTPFLFRSQTWLSWKKYNKYGFLQKEYTCQLHSLQSSAVSVGAITFLNQDFMINCWLLVHDLYKWLKDIYFIYTKGLFICHGQFVSFLFKYLHSFSFFKQSVNLVSL